MSKLNIAGLDDIVDLHYRYQMSKLDVTTEKNRTVLQNIDKVSGDLGRESGMLIQYFKKYFGTGFVLKNSKYSTTKKISSAEFQTALKEFIEYGVLCPSCRLPETHLSANKSNVNIQCDCCGYNDKININNVNSKSMKDLLTNMMKN